MSDTPYDTYLFRRDIKFQMLDAHEVDAHESALPHVLDATCALFPALEALRLGGEVIAAALALLETKDTAVSAAISATAASMGIDADALMAVLNGKRTLSLVQATEPVKTHAAAEDFPELSDLLHATDDEDDLRYAAVFRFRLSRTRYGVTHMHIPMPQAVDTGFSTIPLSLCGLSTPDTDGPSVRAVDIADGTYDAQVCGQCTRTNDWRRAKEVLLALPEETQHLTPPLGWSWTDSA